MKKTTKPNFREERRLWNSNIEFVIGLDEVGRGAFAGPIVAGGVVYKPNFKHKFLKYVNDSKLLTVKQREELSGEIKHYAWFWEIAATNIEYINKFGIGKANSAVFRKVLGALMGRFNDLNHFILIDGFHKKYLPGGIGRQKAIIKGDSKSISIASASIIAKVYRDQLMMEISNTYPNYKFEQNKGYGTKFHRSMIRTYGITRQHRTSFIIKGL